MTGPTPPAAPQDVLTAAAQRHGIYVGPAVRSQPLRDDGLYRSVLLREFDIVTPEVEMKWEHVHPRRSDYDFARADEMVRFARENGLAVHGHPLVWHNQNPEWLEAGGFSRQELIEILRDHIFTVVGRYRGRIALWDVVNEPVETRSEEPGYGELRSSLWLQTIGPSYIEMAFRFAHEADPNAKLIYNQFGIEDAPASTSMAIIRGLIERGTPIHGVGFENHVQMEGEPRLELAAKLSERMAEAASLGLDVYITEMDVAVLEPWTPVKGEQQAQVFDAVLAACLSQPACKGFQTWGFTDRHTWIPEHFPGFTAPLLFDSSYFPKPAYQAVLDRLNTHPVTPRTPR